MSTPQRDYVDVVYNEADRPLTDYPRKLARYLFDRYGIARTGKLGRQLLNRAASEMAIRITPEQVLSWDFTARMSEATSEARC